MNDTIAARAKFDEIRYAQVWEDADILREGLAIRPGDRVLSIGSAGDNAIALLLDDPSEVIALDLSVPQVECIRLRVAAYGVLDHGEFLELMGSRSSTRRGTLLDRVIYGLTSESAAFWDARREQVIRHGAAGIGKFERYFRIFRTMVLPLVHSRSDIDRLLGPAEDRAGFYDRVWDNRRWRLMLSLFFSNRVMGRLGRDAAFFDHVKGSLSEQVAHRTRHALVELDPSRNPYLHWILRGTHGDVLPAALREDNYPVIRERIGRLRIENRPIEEFTDVAGTVDRFNLSDIFEYLDAEAFSALYGTLLDLAAPKARLVYWNMMAPRRCPPAFAGRIVRDEALELSLHARDKAFFYSDIVVETLA